MYNATTHKLLPTSGDQDVYPGGQPIREITESTLFPGKVGIKYLPMHGQLAFFVREGEEWLSLAPEDLLNYKEITIALFQSDKGDGNRADYYLSFGAEEKINPCTLGAINGTEPTCGQSSVVDSMWDCVGCGDTLNFIVFADDYRSRGAIPGKRDGNQEGDYPSLWAQSYTYPVPVNCCYCSECETGVDCQKVQELLLRRIWGLSDDNRPRDYSNIIYYGDNGYAYAPFYAMALTEFRYSFCLEPIREEGCTNTCTHVAPITEFSVGGETLVFADEGLETVDATGNTPISVLEDIAHYAHQFLINTNGVCGGGVALELGTSPCCPPKFIVNSCTDDVDMSGLADCSPLDEDGNKLSPLENFNIPNKGCKGCGVEDGETPYAGCGVTIVGKTRTLDCEDCYPDLSGELWLTTGIQTAFTNLECKGGPKGIPNVTTQYRKRPTGSTLQLRKWMMYQDEGGAGRDIRVKKMSGYPLRIDDTSRWDRVNSIKCEQEYCIIGLDSKHYYDDRHLGFRNSTSHAAAILIPTGDTNTWATLEPYFEALNEGHCKVKIDVSCFEE